MVILSRHFLASFIGLFVTILCVALTCIVVIELLVNFDEIADSRPGLRGALSYLFLRLPSYYVRDLVPIVAFAAGYLCFALPARRQEMMATRAGGIAPQRLALPILAAAAVLAVGTLILNETVVLRATERWNRLGRGPGEITLAGSLWSRAGDDLYNVARPGGGGNGEPGVLGGVNIYQLTPAGLLRSSHRARAAEVRAGNRWTLRDAVSRRFEPSQPERAPTIERLETLHLDLGRGGAEVAASAQLDTLPLQELSESIRSRRVEGRAVARHRALFHSRLAEPLSLLVFTCFALPLGASVERTRSLTGPALRGVAVVAVFYVARLSAVIVASRADASVAPLLPWLVVAGFGALGLQRLLSMPR